MGNSLDGYSYPLETIYFTTYCSLFLSRFRFTISHRAGTLNKADHLTWRSDHQEGVEFDNSDTMVLHPSIFRINATGQRSPAPKKTL